MLEFIIRRNSTEINITAITNGKTLSVEHSLCSTKWKSVTDKMSVDVIGARSPDLYKTMTEMIISAMEAGDKIDIKATENNTTLFMGYLETDSLNIKSAKIPLTLSLDAESYIVDLDKKPTINYTAEDTKVSDIVKKLLEDANPNRTLGLNELGTRKLKYFVLTEDNTKTYRDIIDLMLFECGGFVLYWNYKNSTYEIRSVLHDSDTIPRVVNYMMNPGLESKYTSREYDGVSVEYPTVGMMENALVYSENISLEENDSGLYVGKEIAPKTFYPENGEKVATYQSFKKNLLDKPYQDGTSSLQNSDLDLLYVKAEGFNLEISATPDKVLTQPEVDAIKKPAGLVVYPRKAWCLLYNDSEESVYLNALGMRGTAVYKTATNTLVMPAESQNPDEYTSAYIYSEEEAKSFSLFYYNFKRLAGTITTWSEPTATSYVGEIVAIKHPDTNIEQKHLVVSIERSGGSGIATYNVTAVSIATHDPQSFRMYSEMFSPVKDNTKKIVSQTVYYAGTIDNKAPSYNDVTLLDPPLLNGSTINYIWAYTRTLYADGSASNSGITCVSQYVTPSTIAIEGLPDEIPYYADNIIATEDSLTVTVKTNDGASGKIVLYINNTEVASRTSTTLSYEIKPSMYLDGATSFSVTAKIGQISTGHIVRKDMMQGVLQLTASSTVVEYYADNIPHENEDVTLSISSTGYSKAPKLYIDGAEAEYADNSYTIPASSFKGKAKMEASAKIEGFASDSVTISKKIDQGYLKLSASKYSFDFYADGVAHNTSDTAMITMDWAGFSTTPTLYKAGTAVDYPTDGYAIKAEELTNIEFLKISASRAEFSDEIILTKVYDNGQILLVLSDEAVEFYADNVPLKDSVTATVTYSGLFKLPSLTVDGDVIELSNEGVATISTSLLLDKASIEVKAFSAKANISSAKTIAKLERSLVLSIGMDSTQFSIDADGNISPSKITLSNKTTGLSDKSKVSLMVGGEAKAFDADGNFNITPEMITGRYIIATIGYGGETASATIIKTYDGKGEEVQYSKSKSFKIYPDEEYMFEFNEDGLVYNGEEFAWLIAWSETMPEAFEGEYVWRRSRSGKGKPWQYVRLTGLQGEDGKAGEYLGHYTTAPAKKPDGSDINDGDYYLNVSESGSPLPYIYKDGQWVLVTADSPNWSQIASATMNDVNNYGGSLLSTSAYYAFFQLLSAQKAFIKSLSSQEITLNEGGAIQSENYKSSGGAEGFRIEADGDVDFNSGTWRGSFANGLSFIPPTRFKISKGMTQREAYRIMKKAGVAEGTYLTAGNMRKNMATGYSPRSGNGFSCLDYDTSALSMNIPLFANFTCMLPLDNKYLIGINYDKSTSTSKAYIATRESLAGTMFGTSNLSEHPIDAGVWTPKLFKLTEETTGSDAKNATYCVGATVCDGKIITWNGEDTNYKLFSLDTETMALVDEGNLDFGEMQGSVAFSRYVIPMFYFHKVSKSFDSDGNEIDWNGWETVAWGGSAKVTDFSPYVILRTQDLKTYEVLEKFKINSFENQYKNYLLDVVRCGTRFFAQALIDDYYVFGEVNVSAGSLIPIPNGYNKIKASTLEILPKLVVKDSIIYGSVSGGDFFKYDTRTDEFTDCSEIFNAITVNIVDIDTVQNHVYRKLGTTYTLPVRANVTETLSDGSSAIRFGKSYSWKDSYLITAIDYCDSLGGIVLTIINKKVTATSVVLYKPNGDIKILSPTTTEGQELNGVVYALSPFAEKNGEYLFGGARYMILASNVDDSAKIACTINNPTMDDTFDAYNKNSEDKEFARNTFFGNRNVPFSDSWLSGMGSMWKYMNYIDIDNEVQYSFPSKDRMLRFDDETINVNCIVPFMNIGRIYIRDAGDRYELVLGATHSVMYNFSYYFLSPMLEIYMFDPLPYFITPNTNMLPILTIKKDSDETVGATFYWDFPAQLGVSEDISNVIENESFLNLR